MAGLRAALLPLVLPLTSLALVSVTGEGKSGRRRLAGGPAGPRLSLSLARGKELGPDCLPRPPAPAGASASRPSLSPPRRRRSPRGGAQEAEARGPAEGGCLQWLGRNSCRQRWGRGCPGIWESEVNYLS